MFRDSWMPVGCFCQSTEDHIGEASQVRIISSASLADGYSRRFFHFWNHQGAKIHQGVDAFLTETKIEHCIEHILVRSRDVEIMIEAPLFDPVIPEMGIQVLNHC